MSEVKTKPNNASVQDFVNHIDNNQRRLDSLELLNIFKEITGLKPVMWGTAIIGYGMYHYKSERSNQQGDWPLIGFSPRKQSLTLYISMPKGEEAKIFNKLGKHKLSKACLYINKLSDVDIKVLKQILKKSYLVSKKRHS